MTSFSAASSASIALGISLEKVFEGTLLKYNPDALDHSTGPGFDDHDLSHFVKRAERDQYYYRTNNKGQGIHLADQTENSSRKEIPEIRKTWQARRCVVANEKECRVSR